MGVLGCVLLTGLNVAGLCAADADGLILSFDRSSLGIASCEDDLAFSEKR